LSLSNVDPKECDVEERRKGRGSSSSLIVDDGDADSMRGREEGEKGRGT